MDFFPFRHSLTIQIIISRMYVFWRAALRFVLTLREGASIHPAHIPFPLQKEFERLPGIRRLGSFEN